MRLFLQPLQIGDTEGFTAEKDIFGRSSLGKGMTNLLSSISDPVVVALDGQWGAGKTTFLKMWSGDLRKAGFPVVYLDAFQNDYAEDAFTAVAGEIIALAAAQSKAEAVPAKVFLEKAVVAGKVILRSSLKLGVKAATLGALDAADLENVASDWAKEASELEDKYVGELLTKQKDQKQAIQAFREALEALPKLLTTKGEDSSTKPLVIIVDELDRCRPVFALEVLERIKHFFSVPNVHFVLGVHLSQLRNSVNVAYGGEIDSNLYLQKFIHLTLHLTDEGERIDQWAATRFINYAVQNLDFKPEHYGLMGHSKTFILHIARTRDLSLRTIERILSTMALALASQEKTNLPAEILGGLCVLKNTDPELFMRAKLGTLNFSEVETKLAFHVKPADLATVYSIEHGVDIWMHFLGSEPIDDRQKAQASEFRRWFGEPSPKLLAWVANSVIDKLQLAQ